MSKKNQHYVPKFYLRYFSFRNNLKEIGIYNFENNFFKQNVPLKHQCSKNFFYGEDEIIENHLSEIEREFSICLNSIIAKKDLNKSNLDELHTLLQFVVLTDVRSLTHVENLKDFPKRVNSLDEEYNFPKIEHNQSIRISLSVIPQIIPSVIDLDYKLLYNESIIPFISSDYPLSKYNLLFEKIPKYFSTTGYKCKGLLIFAPITPQLTVVFFDKTTYKFGKKKERVITITDNDEINQLNLLQLLYSNKIIFFNENISEQYIIELKTLSQKFKKPTNPIIHKAKLLGQDGQENELVINRTNPLNINLKLSSLKIHSGSKKLSIDPLKINLRS